ncbi:unnamed protein product [Schistosoma mattheei]|uniref:Uncharacterized protein n=1 Tax=Schistosoma mattheei TaxID=31246 RepID=A0AA85B5Y0_9TREM|nr:unnamed protein product [Schistosoma mattheei]
MKTQLSELFIIMVLTILILSLVNVYSLSEEQNPHKQFYDPLYEYSDYINREIIPNKRYIRFGKRGADDAMSYGGIPALTRHKTYSIYDLLKERQ